MGKEKYSMKTIPLTRGYFTIVDDQDYYNIMQWKWCVKPHGRTAYAIRRIGLGHNRQTTAYLHHFIVGTPSLGFEVDHIDGNGLNNTRANLRLVTHSENMQNQHQPKSSKFVGVIWDKSRNKWQARIKGELLGRFLLEEDAVRAIKGGR
jgi:hypothetical protein